jgi:hypothetical protein
MSMGRRHKITQKKVLHHQQPLSAAARKKRVRNTTNAKLDDEELNNMHTSELVLKCKKYFGEKRPAENKLKQLMDRLGGDESASNASFRSHFT